MIPTEDIIPIVKNTIAASIKCCQTAHCGRCKPHFDFGVIASPIVPYRNLPQAPDGMTADCRSLVWKAAGAAFEIRP